MEASLKVLVVAGVLVLVYGFFLGIPMAKARSAAAQAPRHLVNTHLEALIAGGILLGLTAALSFSTLPRGLELTAAILVTAGVVLSLLGGTINWLEKTDDPFTPRSRGFMLQAASGPASLIGIVLVAIGVLKAL